MEKTFNFVKFKEEGFIEIGGIVLVLCTVIALSFAATGVNILQNGVGGWNGKSVTEILGVPADKATVKDIEKLSKSEVMQLFYAADAPSFETIKGEYKGQLINVGILALPSDYLTHHFFCPPQWVGKAFFPFEKDKGWGYNVCSGEGNKIIRMRKMDTYMGVSNMDKKKSFHLHYASYNSDLFYTMHDEIRKINDNLYIGMGYMAVTGGSINPFPFVHIGPPTPWVGIDDDR